MPAAEGKQPSQNTEKGNRTETDKDCLKPLHHPEQCATVGGGLNAQNFRDQPVGLEIGLGNLLRLVIRVILLEHPGLAA